MGKPRGEGRRQGGRGAHASGGMRPKKPVCGANAGQGCGNAENSCAGDGGGRGVRAAQPSKYVPWTTARAFLRAPHSPFAEGAQWPKQTKVEGKVCAGRKKCGARMRAKQPRPQGRGCPDRSRVYLKTPNGSGSEGVCAVQGTFSQEYCRISRKNGAAQREKARCPGALGVGRIHPNEPRRVCACGREKGPEHVWRRAVFLRQAVIGGGGAAEREDGGGAVIVLRGAGGEDGGSQLTGRACGLLL